MLDMHGHLPGHSLVRQRIVKPGRSLVLLLLLFNSLAYNKDSKDRIKVGSMP